MNQRKTLNNVRARRARRARAKIKRSQYPRLSVFKSNKYIYAQIIDDEGGVTKAHTSSRALKKGGKTKEIAKQVGKAIAEKAKEQKITNVVFDRGRYTYHGRIKALADAAREAGLKL